jgi:hypothetical protein
MACGICASEVLKEERNKFINVPITFDQQLTNAIVCTSEVAISICLAYCRRKEILEFSEVKRTAATIFLVLAGISSAIGTSAFSEKNLKRFNVTSNMWGHLIEVFTNGFTKWSDYIQVITGIFQVIFGVMALILQFQETTTANENADPAEEQLR